MEEKIKELISAYKIYLKKTGGLKACNELYKWKLITSQVGHPNLHAEDFQLEIKNLQLGNMGYGPQMTTIKNLAKYEEEKYKSSLNILYDESKPLQERIETFIFSCNSLWKLIKDNFQGRTKAMCDERLIGNFLTLQFPQKYTFYKSSVYNALCTYLNIPIQKPTYKLVHYYELINTKFIPLINQDSELLNLINEEIKANNYIDSIPLIAQDIMWHFSIEHFEKIKLSNYFNYNEIEDMATTMPEYSILKQKKQIILQGAPGTGKTYKTAEIAVALCENTDISTMNRKEIMDRYKFLINQNQISFTTFHQSMDYEEFVEGIKLVNENNNIIYKIKDGIFKRIAKTRKYDFQDENGHIILRSKIGYEKRFDSIYKSLVQEIKEEERKTLSDNKNEYTYYVDEKDYIKAQIASKEIHIQKKHLQKIWNLDITLDNIDQKIDDYNKPPHTFDRTYYRPVIFQLLKQNLSFDDKLPDIKESNIPYVLIIDEINRGNISKIFGELITLLEADKRIGEENEITVTLPYSGEQFGVPSNLYIIGTMNTADRSVGYIDYAIRRRFAFITLKADRNVIKKYDNYDNEGTRQEALNYFDLINNIMERVSSELNKEDLMIGHSYFLAKSKEELRNKMIYEVRPLLLEYINDGILNIKKEDAVYQIIMNLGEE